MASNRVVLTYGILPTESQYDAAWDKTFEESLTNEFTFRNDKRVGSVAFNQRELWQELQQAKKEHDRGDEKAGEWCSSVLESLGIEWV